MKRQTLEINGETFELFKADAGASARFTGTGAAYDAIYDAYGRPSDTKVSIWHDWCDWCYELNRNGIPCTLEISSHNCMQFSITGMIKVNDKVYSLWITRCHNRAYMVV